MLKKIILVLTNTFSILITFGLITGLILSILFLIGFVIGGQTGSNLCSFISSHILPYEYLLAEITAVLGIVKMYLCKEKAFVMDIKIAPRTNK